MTFSSQPPLPLWRLVQQRVSDVIPAPAALHNMFSLLRAPFVLTYIEVNSMDVPQISSVHKSRVYRS